MQTKTIAMILLVAIATIGAIGIAVEMGIQSAHAFGGETNPSTGNPHPHGEPTGNAHQGPRSGDAHGQSGGFGQCPGGQ